MAFDLTNYYKKTYDNQVKRTTKLANEQKKQVNRTYDDQIKKLKTDAENQIIAAENSYDSAYATNAVQRAINERQIRTAMANAGLTDSGLHRTQQTAVALQKANADNAITLNKTSFINKIRSTLQDSIFQTNKQRNTQIDSINNQLTADTNSIYNNMDEAKRNKLEEITKNIALMNDPAQATQAAGYIKTVSKQYGIDANKLASYSPIISVKGYNKYLQNENYFQNRTAIKTLQDTISGIDTTSASGLTVVAKQIKAYANQNKITESQLKKILSAAGISYNDYRKFLKDGMYFKKREDSYNLSLAKKASSSSGSSGGVRLSKSSNNDNYLSYDYVVKYFKDNKISMPKNGLIKEEAFLNGVGGYNKAMSYQQYLRKYIDYAQNSKRE